MLDLTRRSLLKKSALGTLALGGGVAMPRIARADQPWAELPSGFWPAGTQPKKVLEIFCYSGMSQWETFWVTDNQGMNTKNWRGFTSDVQSMNWYCSPDMPASSEECKPFGNDAEGTPVFWGPATKPLWRDDIFSRVRMITQAHDLNPHEAAVPLGLTGRRLGNPRMAGLGSAIQHRLTSLVASDVPYSYVLSPDILGIGYDFVPPSAVANGQHPGSALPMLIKIGDASFVPLLQRPQMTAAADHLLVKYQEMYREGLRFQGMGNAIRSAGFGSYDTAVNFLLRSSKLYDLFNNSGALNVTDGPICGAHGPNPGQVPNKTRTALEVATLLLNNGAGYACVLDAGVVRENGQQSPYDTHVDGMVAPGQHVEVTSANVFNLCRCLADKIDLDPNTSDPTKLGLNNVLIIIHSEFGRTPGVGGSQGRDHFPEGYAAMLIGGPIVSRSILGALQDNGYGVPNKVYSPTDVHGAAMLVAGIDPFASENFAVQEFSINDGGDDSTRDKLKTTILGV